mgnify:CR=1 FL=1
MLDFTFYFKNSIVYISRHLEKRSLRWRWFSSGFTRHLVALGRRRFAWLRPNCTSRCCRRRTDLGNRWQDVLSHLRSCRRRRTYRIGAWIWRFLLFETPRFCRWFYLFCPRYWFVSFWRVMGGLASVGLLKQMTCAYALSLRCLACVGFDRVDFGLDRCSSRRLGASRRGLLRCPLGCWSHRGNSFPSWQRSRQNHSRFN